MSAVSVDRQLEAPAPRRGPRLGVDVWPEPQNQYRLEIRRNPRLWFRRSQQVTKIGVAPLIEGACQSNSRLDRSYHAGPGNLVAQQHLICTFTVWRSDIRRRRSEFDITLDSAPATGKSVSLSRMPVGRPPVLAGVHPARHAFDGNYSTAGNQVASSLSHPWSRTEFGRGIHAESFRSASRQTDVKAAPAEPF